MLAIADPDAYIEGSVINEASIMGGIGIWQIVIVALVVLVLFGRGRISEMMGDFGKGVSSFRSGLKETEAEDAPPPRIEAPDAATAPRDADRVPAERRD